MMIVKVVDGEVILTPSALLLLQKHSAYCREHLINMDQLPKLQGVRKNRLDLSGFSVSKRLLCALLGDGRVPDSYDILLLTQIMSMLQVSIEFYWFLLRFQYSMKNILNGSYIPALYYMLKKDSQLEGVVPFVLSIFNVGVEMIPRMKQCKNYHAFRGLVRNMMRSNQRFENMVYKSPGKYTILISKCRCARCMRAWHQTDLEYIKLEIDEYRTGSMRTKMINENPHWACPVCYPENSIGLMKGFQVCEKPLKRFIDT